jgi:hypothetical protein
VSEYLETKPKPTIVYVEVPAEGEPVSASNAASGLALLGIYHTLRNGGDITIPSLDIVLKKKPSEE